MKQFLKSYLLKGAFTIFIYNCISLLATSTDKWGELTQTPSFPIFNSLHIFIRLTQPRSVRVLLGNLMLQNGLSSYRIGWVRSQQYRLNVQWIMFCIHSNVLYIRKLYLAYNATFSWYHSCEEEFWEYFSSNDEVSLIYCSNIAGLIHIIIPIDVLQQC